MTWYELKGLLLLPYITAKRWQYRNASPLDKAILEANRYSRAFSAFAQRNIDNQLLIKDLALSADSLVMDVGGFDGDWTAAVREQFDSNVYVYEPMPTALGKLHSRFDADQKVTICPVGLAASSRSEELSLQGPGSSVISQDSRNSSRGDNAPLKTVAIQLQDTAEAFAELGDANVDLFKINIEGAEFEVLQRMLEFGLQNRCSVLMIQYHEFAPDAHKLRREINRELEKTHRDVWSYEFVWERWEKR